MRSRGAVSKLANRKLTALACAVILFLISLACSLPLIKANSAFFYHEDDAHHFNRSVEMARSGDLNPHYFNKPALHFYLRLPFIYAGTAYLRARGELDSIKEIRTRDPYGLAGYAFTPSHPKILSVTRAVSASWSGLIACLTFAAFYIFRQPVWLGLIAAGLVIVSPEVLKNSYVVGVDTLMALICLATSITALSALRQFSRLKLGACALLAGLACAAKYNAAPIVIVPLTLWWLSDKSLKGFLICAVIPAIGFVIGAPFSIIAFDEFIKGVSYEAWHYGVAGHVGHTSERGWPAALIYLRWLLSDGIGVIGAALTILGASWLSVHNRRCFLLLASFPIAYLLLMIMQKTHFTRNMVVIVPYLAILAGYGLRALFDSFKRSTSATVVVSVAAFLALIPLAITSAKMIIGQLNRAESRLELAQWIKAQRAPNKDIAVLGSLQLPISLFALPGVDAFGLNQLPIAKLVQAGYDYIAVPSDPQFLDQSVLAVEQSIAGLTWPQRVPQNPAISLLRVKPDGAEIAAKRHPAAISLKALDSNTLAPLCSELASEGHCWLTNRITELQLPPLNNPASLRVMSPWSDQELTVSAPDGTLIATVKLSAPMSWSTLTLPNAPNGRVVLFKLSTLHSPQSQGISQDQRRLGIAIR